MMIEFHLLKNYPPVNLNRDDTGAPKTCFFGGVQRGRISSQSLKRSWRTSELFHQLHSMGIRTRHMPELVTARLQEKGVEEEFREKAKLMLTGIFNKEGKENKKGITEQIVMYSPDDIDKLTQTMEYVIEADENIDIFKARKINDLKKAIDGAEARPITADIALFGRMVTSECFRDVEAAIQVAHAISTHAVNRENDFFTAVDDLMEDGEIGAGMMGDTDFNSCCYYEYAALDIDQLRENLKDTENSEKLVRDLITALLHTIAYTNPSGKQNSFAGHIFPSLLMLECKEDKIPLSYVNAFEKPVSCFGRKGIVEESIRQLVEHVQIMDTVYHLPIKHRAWLIPQSVEDLQLNGEKFYSISSLADNLAVWIDEGKDEDEDLT